MKFALFRCCVTSVYLKQYESSTDAVLAKLGVELVDIPEFNCCGYPLKNYDFKAYVLSSARNLCLAEKRNLNIMTLCNCCYGSLKDADHLLREDPSLRKEINATLQKEGLNYDGRVEIRHLLDIFHKDVGIDQISQRISKTFEGPKIATHYGCHILRPRQVVQFDDPEEPTIFDTLVEVTGAESVDWKDKVKCCGAPVWGINDDLSMDLIEKKITDARQSGAEYLCVSCAYCQLQFDRVQKMLNEKRNKTDCLPSILYTQLLGLCLGVDAEILGIHQNELSISGIIDYLS
ncbi:MAG: CoB--CoM heterodisulfide reductase iron-sulfur subunit B family protein [Deltaproteobacteria bacterium]|nr:CoB--CoM heterodisulfide reductase iron-sulfur subunit B family protein [Deltaproteobacteria bacterium]